MIGSKRRLAIVQVAASVVLLFLAIVVARPVELVAAMKSARAAILVASLAFVPALLALRALRWHIIARTRKPDMTFGSSLHSYLGGLTLATLLPPAELARGALAAPDDKAGFVGLTFLDKMIDVVTLFLFACAGFAVVAPGWQKAFGLAAALAALAGLAAAGPVTRAIEKRLPRWRITGALRRALAAASAVPARVLAVAFLVATANLALYYVHLYVIMYAFSPSMRPEAVGLFPLITLSRVIPSVGGLGVREFTASALFTSAHYEITGAAAMEASLLQFVTVNVIPAAVWLVVAGGFGRLIRRGGDGL